MQPRSRQLLTKLASAFLFALLIAFLGYIAFWGYSMRSTEKGLVDNLQNMLGGNVHYSGVKWDYDPTQIHLLVKDVSTNFQSRETGVTIRHHLGDLNVTTDFFQDFRVTVQFPSQQKLEVISPGGSKNYRLLMEDGELSFYPQYEGGELIFSTLNMVLMDGEAATPLLRAGDVFFSKVGGGRTVYPLNWRVTTTELYWRVPGLPAPLSFDGFELDAELRRFPHILARDAMSLFLSGDQRLYRQTLLSTIENIAGRGSGLVLKELKIGNRKDGWVSLKGNLSLDNLYRPEGEVFIATNDVLSLFHWLAEKGFTSTGFLDENRRLRRILTREELVTVNLAIRSGAVSVNGLSSGIAPPVTGLLHVEDLLNAQ